LLLTNGLPLQVVAKIFFSLFLLIFCSSDNVIKDEEPVWKQDDYTPFGKWMDGWESRRRRTEGHDWCLIQLGLPGFVRVIEIDTCFFTGNFSPVVSVYGIQQPKSMNAVEDLLNLREDSKQERPEHGRMGLAASAQEFSLVSELKSEEWPVLIPLSPLGAGYEATRKTIFQVPSGLGPLQYLRLNMGPDGGIARIRVYGEVTINPENIPSDKEIDLAYVENGGMAIACSNKHYGHIRNLIVPGRGNCMGDGWETARQPKRPPVYQKGPDGLMLLPGYDWTVLQLGVNGMIKLLEIDTHFYAGNYPESVMVEGTVTARDPTSVQSFLTEDGHAQCEWKLLLPRTRLSADKQHFFSIAENSLNQVFLLSFFLLLFQAFLICFRFSFLIYRLELFPISRSLFIRMEEL
jgi:allantoicase